jgi:hypothetical protein
LRKPKKKIVLKTRYGWLTELLLLLLLVLLWIWIFDTNLSLIKRDPTPFEVPEMREHLLEEGKLARGGCTCTRREF